MNYKGAIALDLDGTLLNGKGQLGNLTKRLLRVLSSDYLIILASGRPLRSMRKLCAELQLSLPLICYNGAAVYLSPFLEPLLYLSLETEKLKQVYEEGKSFLTSFACEDKKAIYSLHHDAYLSRYFPFEGMEVHLGEEEELPPAGLMACLLRCPHRYDDRLKEIVEKQKGFKFRHWVSSTYSEITREDVDKGKALALLLAHFHLNPKDCYAFGDSTNDEPMLSLVGHPFLLADSHAELPFPRTEKGHAEEGVAYELSKLFRL